MKRAVGLVLHALDQAGLEVDVRSFPAGTRTARDAAAAIGVEVGQIVKSLVFARPGSGRALLVLVSGSNQAGESRLAQEGGEPAARADADFVGGGTGFSSGGVPAGGPPGRVGAGVDADFVRAATGFSIGGVRPVGHPEPLETLIDEDLLRYGCVWAAAGTPTDVFPIAPDDLVRATGGRVVGLARG